MTYKPTTKDVLGTIVADAHSSLRKGAVATKDSFNYFAPVFGRVALWTAAYPHAMPTCLRIAGERVKEGLYRRETDDVQDGEGGYDGCAGLALGVAGGVASWIPAAFGYSTMGWKGAAAFAATNVASLGYEKIRKTRQKLQEETLQKR